MSLLTMTANHSDPKNPPKAETILKLATHMLGLIRTIEKEHARTDGRRYKPIHWGLRLYMFSDRSVIELDAPGGESAQQREIGEKVSKMKMPDVEGVG